MVPNLRNPAQLVSALLLVLAWADGPALGGTAGPKLEPARIHAVVAGVLEWPDRSLGSFSKQGRLDAALGKALTDLGAPAENVTVLLDDDASLAGIRAALDASLARVGEGDTLLFYYAGHGLLRPGGKVFFANHDIQSRSPEKTGLALAWLAERLSKDFKGARVLLMADCCYSGALAQVVRTLQRKGIQAASLTSAASSNTSTGNWTFTLTLLACLAGDPLADRDGDGHIRLGEARAEVAEAMKHIAHQRSGFESNGLPEELILAPAKKFKGARPDDLGEFVRVTYEGTEAIARISGRAGKKVRVRFFEYNKTITRQVARASLEPLTYRRHPKGAKVGVLWGKKVYPAKVLETDGDFHWITYPGWDAYWDEWVMADRIVASDGSAEPGKPARLVEIEWRGRWYPGVVLRRDGQRYRVHYVGYDASWDEWVPPERIKPRPR